MSRRYISCFLKYFDLNIFLRAKRDVRTYGQMDGQTELSFKRCLQKKKKGRTTSYSIIIFDIIIPNLFNIIPIVCVFMFINPVPGWCRCSRGAPGYSRGALGWCRGA